MDHSLLLDQIASGDAEERGSLRVYADQLIERGDPFGELIVVASERTERETPELRRREEALIEEQTKRLRALLGHQLQAVKWRRGFVEELELKRPADEPAALIQKLAAEPVLRLVRRLEWGAVMDGSGDMAPVFAELARSAARFPRLVEIVVRQGGSTGNPWIDGVIELHEVWPLYAAFPRLEVLDLHGREIGLGDVVLPNVRRLALAELALDDVRRIVAARVPKLEELALGFRSQRVHNIAATFGPLLHRDFGPQLSGLAIEPPDNETLRWVIAELPTCPLARHVRRLGFLRADLDDDMMRMLIADAHRWSRLERLELRDRTMSASRINELARAFGRTLALV